MIQYERQQSILRLLERMQTASIKQLAEAVFASEASVRRDIEALEKRGYVQRIYGGVILSKYKNCVVPLDLRDADNSAVKETLARRAAELVGDGATVLLDASSTARRIIKYLERRRNLKIITNNQRVFNETGNCDAQFYCTGGIFSGKNHAFIGPAAEAYVRSVSADILFFSSQGISADGEISDVSEEETSLRRVMLSRAERRVFLCDSSKLGVRRIFRLCDRCDVTDIICDKKLPWEQ